MSRKIWITLFLLAFACATSVDYYIKRAERYSKKYGLENWKKAEKFYDLALQKGADLAQIKDGYETVLLNIATLYLYYQDYPHADTYIKKAEKYFALSPQVRLLRAIYYIRNRRFDMGQRILESLESQGYKSADVLYAYATMYFLQKDYERAINYLEKIKYEYKEKTTGYKEVLYMLGYSYYTLKEYYNALRVYKELLKIEDSLYRKARVAQNMATIYIALGDDVSAKRYIQLHDEFIKKLRTENPRKRWKRRR